MTTVVITGANRGIGLELVKHYRSIKCDVIALCRNSSDELNKTGAKVISQVDVGKPDMLHDSLRQISDKKIDLLINNAGVLAKESLEDLDPHTIEHQFIVNALGPLLITQCLLKKLKQGSKVIHITSRMGSMADNTSGGYYGYRMSKAALNAAGVSMAQDLKQSGIAVGLLHPGYVQTDMVNHNGDISAQEAATRLAARISEVNLDNTGGFWHSNGEQLPW